MPWVRLHGVKDYYDIARLSQDYEGWKQTINLVPSLLEQLELYTSGQLTDSFLDLSRKPAADLTSQDKQEILNHFFAGFAPQMVHPYPRYDELFLKRGISAAVSEKHFTVQDFLDLQVWHNITWIDPIWRNSPGSPLGSLIQKQRNFTEEDKLTVLQLQFDILKKIIPLHQQLVQQGKIEVTCTPYFHPILPLLCDSSIAQISNPIDPVPKPAFAYPQDAEWHIQNGLAYFEKTMGFRPKGMWPSEGSVSDAACSLMAKSGINFFATDEAILYRSEFYSPDAGLKKETLYQLHQLATPNGPIDCVFRNHSLSDRIGFVYQSWNPKDAAQDFINHIKSLVEGWNKPVPPLVSTILDGENCWEFYPNDGTDFLKYLIESIQKDPQIIPTTVPEFQKKYPAAPTLKSIFPGSWINNNFRIWVGHPEDNAAWHFLRLARERLVEKEAQILSEKKEEAWKLLHIAEGSDWFWWYGDENQSSYEDMFDSLFRNHIAGIYKLLEEDVPEALKRPIKQPKKVERGGGIFFKKPDISSKQKRYYDWVGARRIYIKTSGGAMHQATDSEARLQYGRFDDNLCFTITFEDKTILQKDPKVFIQITKPIIKTIQVNPSTENSQYAILLNRMEGIVTLPAPEINSSQEIWFFIQIESPDMPALSIPDKSELYLQGYTAANASICWFI